MTAQTNRQFLLAKRPVGAATRDTFTYQEVPVGTPADGQVLVHNEYLSLDPVMRGWMNEGKSYIPPVGIGEVMRALGVGKANCVEPPQLRRRGLRERCPGRAGLLRRRTAGFL